MDRNEINQLMLYGNFQGEPLGGKLIETHISWVVLTKSLAFKIKKPIRYSFLDFSTLEKRKFYCERELYLNQRLTDIYLDVQPVVLHEGYYHIGTHEGIITDYTLRMRKLQEVKRMDRLLLKNRINEIQIKKLAQKIASFHQKANIIYTPFNKSDFQQEYNDILSVLEVVKSHLGESYVNTVKRAVDFSNAYLNRYEPLIQKRIKEGLQRDVHGDLHSRNIFLYKDPVIFDCIEFNDAFRQIDVLNEIAFFCMDLEAYGKSDLSKKFVDYYLRSCPFSYTQKEEQLFTYYKCYRANIRAKVNALRTLQAVGKKDLKEDLKQLKKYLQLLGQYVDQ